MRRLARAGMTVLALVLAVLLVAWACQRQLIYLPGPAPPSPPRGVAEVVLRTADGLALTAWAAQATGPRRDVTVLVAPGNAGSRAARVPLARALAAAGFDVLLLEYRGYGGNPGSPTEDGLAADARAALDHLVGARGIPPPRVTVLGESLGAAVAVRLATERPVGALVLRSPFTTLADVGARAYPYLPVRALLRDRFDLLGRAPDLRVPVAVVAGAADTTVPPGQSRAVAAAARATYVEVPGAGHNDADLAHGPAVVAAVGAVSARNAP